MSSSALVRSQIYVGIVSRPPKDVPYQCVHSGHISPHGSTNCLNGNSTLWSTVAASSRWPPDLTMQWQRDPGLRVTAMATRPYHDKFPSDAWRAFHRRTTTSVVGDLTAQAALRRQTTNSLLEYPPSVFLRQAMRFQAHSCLEIQLFVSCKPMKSAQTCRIPKYTAHHLLLILSWLDFLPKSASWNNLSLHGNAVRNWLCGEKS